MGAGERIVIVFEKHKQLDLLNTKTGEINLTHAPDEIRFEVEQFNKRVVTTEFNRVVAEELANHIDPSAPGAGKTLIFAATDAHADIVVSALKMKTNNCCMIPPARLRPLYPRGCCDLALR